jgi:hypothetical protein
MADDKTHAQQGQIERAQRLRRIIDDLKHGDAPDPSPADEKSLKEQIDERARELAQKQNTPEPQ